MLNWIRSLDRVLKGEATKPAALRGGTLDLPVGGLTVAMFAVAGLLGMGFLLQTLHRLSLAQAARAADEEAAAALAAAAPLPPLTAPDGTPLPALPPQPPLLHAPPSSPGALDRLHPQG